MAAEDENSWVFDSLVCFLNGPIWNAPLQSFIEEKSLIFEPAVTENEDYKNIFDEFKNLVDFMLGSFMEDIGITPEQFESACTEGQKYQVTFNYNLFELIWAANDYESFKRLMTQRNVELQLQALELIEQKYGITPQSFIPKKKDAEQAEEDQNIHEIPVTVEQSDNLEIEIMDEVAKTFTEASTSQEEVDILEEKQLLKQALEEVKEQVHSKSLEASGGNKTENVEKRENVETEAQRTPKQTSDNLFFKKAVEIDAVELKKRQEYLRAQRDKLVAMKKDARKKHLAAESGATKNKSKARPKSAKAAEAVLTGEKVSIEPQQLQIRKTLAERLKSEVIGK